MCASASSSIDLECLVTARVALGYVSARRQRVVFRQQPVRIGQAGVGRGQSADPCRSRFREVRHAGAQARWRAFVPEVAALSGRARRRRRLRVAAWQPGARSGGSCRRRPAAICCASSLCSACASPTAARSARPRAGAVARVDQLRGSVDRSPRGTTRPLSMTSTPSSRAASSGSRAALVADRPSRARSPSGAARATAVMMSSVMPSARYSSSVAAGVRQRQYRDRPRPRRGDDRLPATEPTTAEQQTASRGRRHRGERARATRTRGARGERQPIEISLDVFGQRLRCARTGSRAACSSAVSTMASSVAGQLARSDAALAARRLAARRPRRSAAAARLAHARSASRAERPRARYGIRPVSSR